MLNKTIFVLTLVLSHLNLSAQKCKCEEDLVFLSEKIKANYAGYHNKIDSTCFNEYEKMVDTLISNSRGKDNDCFDLMGKLLRFFNDDHLAIGRMSNQNIIYGSIKQKKKMLTTPKMPTI